MKELVCRMIAASIAVFAVCARAADWTLTLPEPLANDALTTISDGNWTINVYIRNAETRELGLGKNDGSPRNAFVIENDNPIGSGDLDFRKGVYESGSALRWTITSLGTQSFADGGVSVNNLYIPEEVTDLGTKVFSGTWKSTSGVLSFVSTNTIKILPNNMFMSCEITNVLLQLPNLKAIGGYDMDYRFLKGRDVSDWDLSSVENIGINNNSETEWADGQSQTFFRNKKFSGTLRLPSLRVSPVRQQLRTAAVSICTTPFGIPRRGRLRLMLRPALPPPLQLTASRFPSPGSIVKRWN